jgi:hypothetical protein
MAARMEKTRHPGIYKRGRRYAFSYRHNGKQRGRAFARSTPRGKRSAPASRPATRASYTSSRA